jgi:hypothetical protein
MVLALSVFGSFISYIYSAPPLKLKQNGWVGNYTIGCLYINLLWWCSQAVFGQLDCQSTSSYELVCLCSVLLISQRCAFRLPLDVAGCTQMEVGCLLPPSTQPSGFLHTLLANRPPSHSPYL